MTLDEMLDGAAAGETTIGPGWSQGRATYGGLVGGMLVARAAALAGERPLRAASVSFIGPVEPGPLRAEGTVLRVGRAVTQVETRLVQAGQPRAALFASFGDDRASAIDVKRDDRPPVPAPEALTRLAPLPGITPEFLDRFDMRFAAGAPPFSGAARPDFGGWVRFAEPPSTFGDRELTVLADAWPPAVAPLLAQPVPASSLSWTLQLTPGHATPAAYWQYDVTTHVASGGYAISTARLWDQDGRLRAISHQTVAVFG
jgi:acyl-CoA thioesterase